jgi:hypothetical protein
MNAETGNDGTLAAKFHTPDLAEAQRFLDLLGGPDARWTFQTFDDDPVRKEARVAEAKVTGEKTYAEARERGLPDNIAKQAGREAAKKPGKDPFAKILHGTLELHGRRLVRLNEQQRAGVFMTVNETDGRGRHAHNVMRVRAIFADLDGVMLQEALAKLATIGLVPHIIVESSPGRWHLYMLAPGFPLDRFTATQKRLISLLGSDPAVHDLPRVMRLPGFLHQKGEPFMTRVVL